jgi:nucleotide-binding universal stress UspA family protein
MSGTNPALELAELCTTLRAGLVVVASHGHSGITRALLGSTSEKLARISPVPVMVVRPAED